MDATIKRLREQGRRKPMNAVNTDPGLRGVLALVARAGKCELRLVGFDPAPAVLFEARLMMLHGDVMLFSGIEYAQDGTAHEQEWSARVQPGWRQGELFAAEDDADRYREGPVPPP
jgi:hypothetical protein